MSGRMDWRRAALAGRKRLNWRDEEELRSRDRAAKWLEKAERRRPPSASPGPLSTTRGSSEAPPW